MAIQKQRGSSLDKIPEVLSGLPFFTPKTLSPIWKIDKATSIVKMPPLNLVNQDGQPVTREDFLNKTSIVGFIFTSCSGFCPLLVKKLQRVEKKIRPKKDIQFVVFSVDPEIDTPKVLKIYAKKQGIDKKNWLLVTGSKTAIHALIRDTFASEVRRLESSNMRKFAHTEHFYLLDNQARLRGVLNGTRIDLPETAMKLVLQASNN